MLQENILLTNLNLQNFATFERQTIDFSSGLNIIIGETGSGKSLIFDALQIVLGQRADKNLVRSHTEFSSIEATFRTEGSHVNEFLDSIGYPGQEQEIVLKRIIYSNGKTKSFINFQQCNLKTLQEFSKRYIDLVGQFENQKLLSPQYQLRLLDAFGGNEVLVSNYQNEFNRYNDLINEKNNLNEKKSMRDQRLDYLNFQINEIEEVNPLDNEEETLIKKKNSLLNVQEREQVIEKLKHLYFESESSISSQLSQMKSILNQNPDLVPHESVLQFENAMNTLEDFSFQISNINQDINPEELEEIIERLDKFQKIKRKFSSSIEEVLILLKNFKEEKHELENIGHNLDKLNSDIELILNTLQTMATQISKKRKEAATPLAQGLSKEIQALNMKGAQIKIELEKIETFEKRGQDHMRILAETNPGEGFYPIEKIASGGELSRILLCIRQLLVGDSISIFLFDEVDTGIGGETALLIGKSLKKVASKSQVIAISHLPQIAINADRIIKVEKSTQKVKNDVRTLSNINILNKKEEIKKETKLMTPLS